MADVQTTAQPTAAPTSTTNTAANTMQQSTLSNWVGPYVTDMLGKASAIADQPYQVYQGAQVAGPSQIQSNLFSGLGSLTVPQNLGQRFTGSTTPQIPSAQLGNSAGYGTYGDDNSWMNGVYGPTPAGGNAQPQGFGAQDTGMQPPSPQYSGIQGATATQAAQPGMQSSGIATQYMNPYLQSVLNPQLDELRRQAQITQLGNNAKLTQAGAFGGSRQAIMDSESQRNLLQEMNKTIGQGYSTAYDKGLQQFNTEQGQAKDLVSMLGNVGQAQRNIEQEGLTSDYNEFLAQRDYPTKQVQFLQSMLQGLPISTVTSTTPQTTAAQNAVSGISGLSNLLGALKNLGIGG